jgi:hypothetical protein
MTAADGPTGGRQWVSVRIPYYKTMTCSCYHIGNLLLKRLLLAVTQAKVMRADFNSFDTSLRQENLAEVIEMEKGVAAWEKDQSCPDPYRIPKSSK